MPFDYEAARTRVFNELTALAEELWPDLEPMYKENNWKTPENKYESFRFYANHVKDKLKWKKLDMLDELYTGKFWHADDFWPELKETLSKRDQDFYATLMIEEARRDKGTLGNSWIVEKYEGELREYISEDLLKESVNRGFWEIANKYFTGAGYNPPFERYDKIMKHKDFLDLSRVEEFKEKPLTIDRYVWIGGDYMECFERARGKLSLESGAWLAKPIIESIIEKARPLNCENNDSKNVLAEGLKPYVDYIATELIQKVFEDELGYSINNINDSDYGYFHMRYAEVLKNCVKMPDGKFKSFVKRNLPGNYQESPECFLEQDFPKDWLDKRTLWEIGMDFVRDFAGWKSKSIVPSLAFMQDAVKSGWVNWIGRIYVSTIIRWKIKSYMSSKRTPSNQAILELAMTLDKGFVTEDVYKNVMNRTLADLIKREQSTDASDLYLKGLKDEWLDKSRFSDFKIVKPTPEKEDIPFGRSRRISSRSRTSKPKERPTAQPGQAFLDKYI